MTPTEFIEWLDKEIESCRYILHKATCEEDVLIETEGRKFGLERAREMFLTMPISPLPGWIIDRGNNYYTIDIEAARASGETIPIQLWKIPQLAKFFAAPPQERGSIEFK